MDSALRSWGLVGQKVTARYYFGDVNCTHPLENYGVNGRHYDPGTQWDHTSASNTSDIAWRG